MPTTSPADRRSKVPRFEFPTTLPEQLAELAGNPLLERFNRSRRALRADRYRPAYHYVNPEGRLNDPNGLCFWQGRWHLFYQAYPPEDPRQHWGHAVSEDLVHWRDLPYAIYPDPEECCFSGTTLVESDRVIAIYHGTKVGTMVATSSDPLLLNWQKLNDRPVIPYPEEDAPALPYTIFDPCLWKHGDHYYALTGGTLPHGPAGKCLPAFFLHRSSNLAEWEYLHPFVEGDRYSMVGDDGACPYFLPLGDHHTLLSFSHMSGGRYLLGNYDTVRQKLIVTDGGRFNTGPVRPGGVHAPSATTSTEGTVVAIFNMNAAVAGTASGWDQIMTLPRRLRLAAEASQLPKDSSDSRPADGTGRDDLRIEPAGDIESLRDSHVGIGPQELPSNRSVVLHGVTGDVLEIAATVDLQNAASVEMDVLRSSDGEEYTRIVFARNAGYRTHEYGRHSSSSVRQRSILWLDTSRSSMGADIACRPPEIADVLLADDEALTLRIFVDRSVVEVFVNEKLCVAARVYPAGPDSVGVVMRARGSDARLLHLDAWSMRSIYQEVLDDAP